MDDKSLLHYVNDTLHSILGYSDKTLVQYIISSAKKARDTNSILNSLKISGIDEGKAAAFAQDLYNKVPHQTTQVNVVAKQRQLEEKKLIELQKKNENFRPVDSDSDDDDKQKVKKEKKRKNIRKKTSNVLQEQEEEELQSKKQKIEEEVEDVEDEYEKERREVEETNQRLRGKDQAKTRKVGVSTGSKQEQEEAKKEIRIS